MIIDFYGCILYLKCKIAFSGFKVSQTQVVYSPLSEAVKK
jgi:hypothetical protein